MICPKCGFEQPEGLECLRCGVIFSRFKGAVATGTAPLPPLPTPAASWADPYAAPVPAGPPAFEPPPAWQPPAATPPAGGVPGSSSTFLPPPSWSAPPAAAPPPAPRPGGSRRRRIRSRSRPPGRPTARPLSRRRRPRRRGPRRRPRRRRPDRSSFPPPPTPAGTFYAGPPTAGGGTLYAGPPTGAAAAGGTAYGGPAGRTSSSPVFSAASELSAGAVLKQTFSIFFSNLLPFLLISVVIVTPLFVGLYFLAARGLANARMPSDPGTQQLIGSLVLLVATVLASPFATAALTYGVFQEMRGRSGTVIDCLRVGLSSLLPVSGTAVLQGLAVGIGFLFCIFPGVILACMLAVSVPAAVEERPGILGALYRSAYLTEGFRSQVFSVLFVIGLVNYGLEVLVKVVALGGGAPDGSAAAGNLLVAESIKQIVVAALTATAAAVLYYRLRSIKESVGVEDLVSIFD